MKHGKKLQLLAVVVGIGIVATGCEPCPDGAYCVNDDPTETQSQLPRATPAPAFAGDPWSQPWASVQTYVDSLVFDTSHTAGHSSFLPLGAPAGPLTLGPFVTFHPEIGAGRVNPAGVAAGRIIARINASAAYPPLGLRAGVSYVWQDSVGGGRLVFVPVNLAPPVTSFSMTVDASYLLPCTIMAAGKIKAFPSGGIQICTCCPSGGYCENGSRADSLTS